MKSSPAIRSPTNCSNPCAGAASAFNPGDILVVKHKIVSKAEGRLVDLATIEAFRGIHRLGETI